MYCLWQWISSGGRSGGGSRSPRPSRCSSSSSRIYSYTWRLMDSHKWGFKSPNMGYKHSYPTYHPTYNDP